MSCRPRFESKVRSCVKIAVGGGFAFIGISAFNGNEHFYGKYLMPALHTLTTAEFSHFFAIKLAKYNCVPRFEDDDNDLPLLKTTVWGLHFANPVGLAAGFDKNGEAVHGLSKLGFGFIEVGSVTPEPQPGNDKPRVFRLKDDKAIINRYGFNSFGHDVVFENLNKQFDDQKPVVVGVNLGKNKESKDASKDYVAGLVKFNSNKCTDYFVINISSPNTPGLRNLQKGEELKQLLDDLLKAKAAIKLEKPLLIKISPDLSYEEKSAIAKMILRQSKSGAKIDGLIVSNTTTRRPETLKSSEKLSAQSGGLSGQPLKDASTEAIRDMYKLTKGSIPIVGVGGVSTGEDAFDKIKAGASLVQLYSAIAFDGPPVVKKIKRELADLLRQNGFDNIEEVYKYRENRLKKGEEWL